MKKSATRKVVSELLFRLWAALPDCLQTRWPIWNFMYYVEMWRIGFNLRHLPLLHYCTNNWATALYARIIL
jgi:hypothetical protein